MRQPIYVRELSQAERDSLKAGLRSSDAFTVRRCQILLSSASGKHALQIAQALHCDDQTVRNAIHTFHEKGLAALSPGSSRPHQIAVAFDQQQVERLKGLLHQSPRDFDKATSLWTLDLAAEVAHKQGLTPQPVSGETIRQTLKREGIGWRRAKQRITSPDPAYELKKTTRPVDPAECRPTAMGLGFCRQSMVELFCSAHRPHLDDRQKSAAMGTKVSAQR